VSDLEQWAKGEGPEPDGVRELLDAAQGVPNLTPEQRKRMRARLRTAIDDDDRAWARRRTMTRVGFGAVALALAAGVALWVRSRAHEPIADRPMPTHYSRGPSSGAPEAPPAPANTAEPEGDGGPVRRRVPR
jgi:hypothetical protein